MYKLTNPGVRDLALSMVEDFERALSTRVDDLPSHGDLVRYAVQSGHRTRPVGCLLSCAAVGGNWSDALDLSIAIELVHKASVIRDDIVDGDSVRSGQASFHEQHGVATAIVISDFLWTLALKEGGFAGDRYVVALAETLREMAVGQLEDVSPNPLVASVDGRVFVEEQKTGSLSQLACRLGAMRGGGSDQEIAAMARYGRSLGTAFQLINDVRNLQGDEEGRSAASDIRKRRVTVLSAFARSVSTIHDAQILDRAANGIGDLPEPDVDAVRAIIIDSGALEFGHAEAIRLMSEARSELAALPASSSLEILDALTQDALLDYAF